MKAIIFSLVMLPYFQVPIYKYYSMIIAESLASRINDSECKLIITMNQAVRGGKLINLKETVDLAIEKCATIKNVLAFKRTENDFKINNEKDILIDNILNNYSTECKPEIMDSEE